MSAVESAVRRGLAFLREGQLPSGEFRAFRSPDPRMEQGRELDSSPFPTSLIAHSLGFAPAPEAKDMIGRAIRFLLAEMEPGGVWRYWASAHPHHDVIPPDVDDIACASLVLRENAVPFPDNRRLLLANRTRAGLFYTWIAPRLALPTELGHFRVAWREALHPLRLGAFWRLNESKPRDVDGVVNANALHYLGESEALRPVVDHLVAILREGREGSCDKWHLSPLNFQYAVSRSFARCRRAFEPVRDAAVGRILAAARPGGEIGGHVLDTALALCALVGWERTPSPAGDRALDALLAAQRPSGAWPAFPLYYGGPKRVYGWGSEELTTGFCIEALLRYGGARAS
jgi:hypothetical protein